MRFSSLSPWFLLPQAYLPLVAWCLLFTTLYIAPIIFSETLFCYTLGMKFIKQTASIPHENSATCTAYEYETNETTINGARIVLSGRYPETGQAVNTISKELVYVLQGQGQAFIKDQRVSLAIGDQLLIEPNEPYYFDGHMELYIACSPAWQPEQHQHIG